MRDAKFGRPRSSLGRAVFEKLGMIRRALLGLASAWPLLTMCDAKKGAAPKSPLEVLATFDVNDPVGSAFRVSNDLLETESIKAASLAVHNHIKEGKAGEVGYGFLWGFTSGYAAKRAAKLIAFVAGVGFVGLQTLSYNGYVTVNYEKIQKKAQGWFDINHDGKLDGKDAEQVFTRAQKVLEYHLPSGSGFGAGLILGLRS